MNTRVLLTSILVTLSILAMGSAGFLCGTEDDYPLIKVQAINQTKHTITLDPAGSGLPTELPVGDWTELKQWRGAEEVLNSGTWHIFESGYWPGDLFLQFVNAGDVDDEATHIIKVTLTEPFPGILHAATEQQQYISYSYNQVSADFVKIDGVNNTSGTIYFNGYNDPAPSGEKTYIWNVNKDEINHIRVFHDNQGTPVTLGTLHLTASPYLVQQESADSSWVRSTLTFTEPSSGHLSFTVTQPYPYIVCTYDDSTP